jgi:DNA polymerase-3 subunit alpha
MENHPSSAGQHAAGVVVTQEPIAEFVAVNFKTGGAMCDKKDAEDLNLLKIDALGLTQLSVFERTLELIGIPSRNGFLETIPLDDAAAFEVLNRGHFAGIFQFTGSTVKSLTKEITIDHIEDMIAITALARPGPIGSGGAEQWVRRRNGVDKVTYPHELFRPHVEMTLGIVLYQEQVMQIGRDIGDLSWEDVNALRRAMSKSLGKEFFDKYGDRWKASAIAKGIPASILDGVWDDLCNYGAMAFNRSHSVAYGLVSYWCCWLKAHHPSSSPPLPSTWKETRTSRSPS